MINDRLGLLIFLSLWVLGMYCLVSIMSKCFVYREDVSVCYGVGGVCYGVGGVCCVVCCGCLCMRLIDLFG